MLGYPVKHSLSPQIHSEFLKQTNLKGGYLCLETLPEKLSQTIYYLQELDFKGVNLTIPHKEAGLKLAHKASNQALFIGAANTLIFEKEKQIFAENTDWLGFLYSLPSNLKTNAQKAIILGAGGSAKAVLAALQKTNLKKVYLFIRNSSSSHNNALALKQIMPNLEVHLLSDLPSIKDPDLIVNATPIGMSSFSLDQSPLPEKFLNNIQNNNCYFYDLIYSPTKTVFLKQAFERGFDGQNGYSMLYLQAAYAFCCWTKTKIEDLKL